MTPRRLPLVVACLASVAGCAVGPDYKQPPAPPVTGYTPEKLAPELVADGTPSNPTQRLDEKRDLQGDWWTLFHNEALTALVGRALHDNPDLKAAQAALLQARENVYAEEGSFFPSVTGSFTSSRNKTATGSLSAATASGNPYYTLHTAQLNVSYNPDVFGLSRRQTESLAATAEAQAWQLEATYLTLTSNLVAAAVTEASLREQIDATQEIIKVESDLLVILNKQLALGGVAGVDVLAQEAQLAQAQATLPPLQKQLAQQRDLIATLSGGLPSQAIPEIFTLASFQLPTELPLSLPSVLVEQRPDIKQAAANLHSASALVGVAIANRLPVLNLTALGGSQALKLDQLFTPGNGFWTLAGSLTQPLFDGGALLHKERGARAAFEQAAAQYQSTVNTAFQNVADSLRALQADADAARVATTAEQTAAKSLAIVRQQLRLGQVAYLSLLNAEQVELQTKLTLVQARASRLADTAALFQALGGGWWHRTDIQVQDPQGHEILGVLGVH
jgi:NodT family efflux transporter outer membrane factor (OMF) lipoprotein